MFDDDGSFTTNNTHVSGLDSLAESLHEFQNFPRQSQPIQKSIAPLLTSRGSEFLTKVNQGSKTGIQHHVDNVAIPEKHLDGSSFSVNKNPSLGSAGYHTGSGDTITLGNKSSLDNQQTYNDWQYDEYTSESRGSLPRHLHNDVATERHYRSSLPGQSVDTGMGSGAIYEQTSVTAERDDYRSSLPGYAADTVRINEEDNDHMPDSFHKTFGARTDNSDQQLQEIYPDHQMMNEASKDFETVQYRFNSAGKDSDQQIQETYPDHTAATATSKEFETVQYRFRNYHQLTDNDDGYNKTANDEDFNHQYQSREHSNDLSFHPLELPQQYPPSYNYEELDQNDNVATNEKAQLRILYDARGRKIEELQRSADEQIQEQAKGIRILQHKLTILTGM